eukprot:996850-Prorocentrum_minimum.AAC.5
MSTVELMSKAFSAVNSGACCADATVATLGQLNFHLAAAAHKHGPVHPAHPLLRRVAGALGCSGDAFARGPPLVFAVEEAIDVVREREIELALVYIVFNSHGCPPRDPSCSAWGTTRRPPASTRASCKSSSHRPFRIRPLIYDATITTPLHLGTSTRTSCGYPCRVLAAFFTAGEPLHAIGGGPRREPRRGGAAGGELPTPGGTSLARRPALQGVLSPFFGNETPSATKRPESAAPSRGKHLHQPEHLAAGRAGKHLAGQRAQLPGGDGAHTLHGQRYAQGGILGAFRPAPPALGERLAPPHNSGDFWPVKQIRTNHTRAVPTRDQ